MATSQAAAASAPCLTINLDEAKRDAVSSIDVLESIVGSPAALSVDKVQSRMSERVMDFVRQSPFCLIATANENGACDVSPRGDPAGEVRIVDDRTLLLPDQRGNNRVDSLRNLATNPHIGPLFLVPGSDETLRINAGQGAAAGVDRGDRRSLYALWPRVPALASLGCNVLASEGKWAIDGGGAQGSTGYARQSRGPRTRAQREVRPHPVLT